MMWQNKLGWLLIIKMSPINYSSLAIWDCTCHVNGFGLGRWTESLASSQSYNDHDKIGSTIVSLAHNKYNNNKVNVNHHKEMNNDKSNYF